MNKQIKKDLKSQQVHTEKEYAKNKELLSESKVHEKVEQNEYVTKVNTKDPK